MIQLKPNTYYKTRDGRKAFVGFIRPQNGTYCVVGYIENDCCVQLWTITGLTICGKSLPADLIAEWSEPKLRPWRPEEVPLGAQISINRNGLRSLIVAVAGNKLWHGNGDFFSLDYVAQHYKHSTDGGKTWLPCGVVE